MKAYPIQFGKYLLLERVNIGGMAEVFKAKTFGVQGFERFVAIKRILPSMSEDDEFINMFVDEARIAVQLSHSNVVQIYELAKFENQYYIAMEFVGGKDMRQVLDRLREKGATVPIPAAAYIASKICDGLDYAHRKEDPSGRPMNIIHRDVSPQNILVSYEGDIKITDFGIAKAEDRASKTQAGVLKGKFAYMSPEQVRGLPIDHRSDIFAVGILLYEMVTGERLFIGESDFSTLERVRNAEVPPPRMHNADIPEVLESIMLKALARDREERYQWASELHDDLQQFLIVDNSIFNPKNLSALVREHYAEEIQQERGRMEEFAALTAPKAMQAVEEEVRPAAAPPASPAMPSGGWAEPADSDKTMIFEVGFDFPEAKTEIGPALSDLPKPAELAAEPEPLRTAATSEVSVSEAAHGAAEPKPQKTGVVSAPLRDDPSRGPLLLVGATVLLCVLILAGVFLSSSTDGTGVIEVTSTPITDVEVFLDGAPVGQGTPLVVSDVSAGSHIIRLKAENYKDRSYLFTLAGGDRLEVPIALEKEVEGAAEVLTGTIQVVSEPPGAAVRINNEVRGETPLTVEGIDRTGPVQVEVSKEGFETIRRTELFEPEQTKRLVTLELMRLDVRDASQDLGVLAIDTVPPGAAVFMRGKRRGTTPLTLTGVERRAGSEVSVSLQGYKKVTKKVEWGRESKVSLSIKLVSESLPRVSEAKKAPPARRVSGKRRCGGSGSKLSVMPVGVADCRVKVGGVDLGIAPIFKKVAPVGNCEIKITCPDGKSKTQVRKLSSGGETRVIIKPGQW